MIYLLDLSYRKFLVFICNFSLRFLDEGLDKCGCIIILGRFCNSENFCIDYTL